MKRILILLCFLLLPFSSFAQMTLGEYIENVTWINEHPSTREDEEYVTKTAEILKFQLFNYPNLKINVGGTKELYNELKDHKYKDYLQIIYSFNHMHYSVIHRKSNNLKASLFAMRKTIGSYLLILAENPDMRIETLDNYNQMADKELKKVLRKLI